MPSSKLSREPRKIFSCCIIFIYQSDNFADDNRWQKCQQMYSRSPLSTIFGTWKELNYIAIQQVQILQLSLKLGTSGNCTSGNHASRGPSVQNRVTLF